MNSININALKYDCEQLCEDMINHIYLYTRSDADMLALQRIHEQLNLLARKVRNTHHENKKNKS